MKPITTVFFLFLFCVPSFGQQLLWSTSDSLDARQVKLEDVTDEVLKIYGHYRYYLDGAGFSKSNFLKKIDKLGVKSSDLKELKDLVAGANKIEVFALRSNSGKGSEVLVFCVSENNVNFVNFTNSFDPDAQIITSFGADRFSSWFQTLMEN